MTEAFVPRFATPGRDVSDSRRFASISVDISQRALTRFAAAALACVLAVGCGETGEPVDAAKLDAAQRLWADNGPRDYDLQWQSISTRNQAVYRAYVRGGEVGAVRLVRPDGKAIALKPADPTFYSVDGLFRTIREELAQSRETRPFGQPPGTTVILTMRSDEKLGYPTLYRRDVFGAEDRMGIDVISLTPSQAEIPPADPPR
jgi:hypothetical protein